MLMKIKLKDNTIVSIQTNLVTLKQELFAPGPIDNDYGIFVVKEHKFINTILHLTNISPCVILQFDESQKYTGASYSLNMNNSPFTIYSTGYYFLLLNNPLFFELDNVCQLVI